MKPCCLLKITWDEIKSTIMIRYLNFFSGSVAWLALAAAFWLTPVTATAAVGEEEACSITQDFFLEQRAKSGDLDAMFEFGQLILEAACTRQQRNHGISIILEAAQSGHAEALFLIGTFLLGDAETSEDKKLGLEFLQKSAETDHIGAQVMLGLLLMEASKTDNDRDEALYWIGSAANAGSINAANLIARMYDGGMHGLKPDACVASLWIEAAILMQNKPLQNVQTAKACE